MAAMIIGGNFSCLGRSASRALAAAAIAGVAYAGFGVRTGEAVPRYDGLWSVSIVTENGDCDRGYRYAIRITHGALGNGSDSGFTIAGNVSPAGRIKVTVSRGSASATGTGRLAGNMGSGIWKGGACSGTWTAERRDS
jgi:hypothetical protein